MGFRPRFVLGQLLWPQILVRVQRSLFNPVDASGSCRRDVIRSGHGRDRVFSGGPLCMASRRVDAGSNAKVHSHFVGLGRRLCVSGDGDWIWPLLYRLEPKFASSAHHLDLTSFRSIMVYRDF